MESKTGHGTGNYDKSFPIVAIGASAGGLESLKRFLSALPKDFGFAIIFIQHFSPRHKSMLPDLLRSGKPDLEIIEASDGLEIRPGKLYICPSARETSLDGDAFRVTDLEDEHVHLSIDGFFTSLAEQAGERAIAVIFSGTGFDGARGAYTVRAGGGTVFVQDPATAEHTEMPLAAINTGQMDGILSPEEIAGEIIKLHTSGMVALSPDNVLSSEELDAFYRLLYDRTGYRFNHYKRSVVGRRIRRRMYLHGISSVAGYIEMVASKEAEGAALASDLMIGVTSFYRDRLAWKALHLDVTRKLTAQDEDSPIRVWCPACATGEEAYSVAMLLRRELDLAQRRRDFLIFATDVNDQALDKARKGAYPASISADVPVDYVQKFFAESKDDQSVTIDKEIRQRVVFARHDVLADPPFSRLDLVVCRNLLIYLEPDAQEKCIALFHYALKEGGYLFLGGAESIGRGKDLFVPLPHKKCRIYQKAETQGATRTHLAIPFAAERLSHVLARQTAANHSESTIMFVQESLLDEYGPAAVVIDHNYAIVYHSGPTHRYLRHPRGVTTQHLLELLPNTARNRIRAALYKSGSERKAFSVHASIPLDDGRKRPVTLRISKLRENLFLIVFREKTDGSEAEAAEVTAVEETAVRQLEHELSATRDELQHNIEQLRSLNEELQSSNEEFQAANEELETSREELQSLNEELTTVNNQLQTKIVEEEEANNDLNNFLASTAIPTIFLDNGFRVKRFTPAMSKLIKLIPADVGRPIIDMSQGSLGPDLFIEARAVLDDLSPVRREFSNDSSWYIRTILPYRTAENRIEGVVVTYTDITELKAAEARTKHLASFPELDPNPVIEVNSSGQVIFSNPGVQRILENLNAGRDGVRALLPDDLDDLLKAWDRTREAVFYREVQFKGRCFGESVLLTPKFGVARIYALDITERKKVEVDLKLSVERLDIISSTASRLLMSEEPQGVLEVLCRRVMEHLGCHVFFNFLVDETINRLRLNAYAGISEHEARQTEFMDFGVGVSGCAARDGVRIVAENIPATQDTRTQLVRSFGVTAYACHPLLARGKVIGTLSFGTKSRPAFGEDELSLMKIVADQVAIAVERAGLLKAAQERTEELEACVEERTADLKKQAELLELAHDAIIVRDREGTITFWNSGAEKTYGWQRDEVLGRVTYEVLDTQFPVPLDDIIAEVAERGRWEGELTHTTKDGGEIVVLARWAAQKDEKGRSVAIMEVNRDITQRKKAEEALRRHEAEFRTLAENAPDLIMRFDRDFRYIYVSPALERMHGIKPETLVGKSLREAGLEPGLATKILRTLEKVLATGKEQVMEFVTTGRRGEKHLSAIVAPEFDKDGRIDSLLAISRDITEQHHLEERLRQAQKMDALGTLTGGIAHDFNNILAAIIGFTDVVRGRLPSGSREVKSLDRVMEAGLRGRELIKQMLTFSRKTEQENKPLQMSSIVKETMKLLRASIPTTINIKVNIQTPWGMVLADPVQLQQVLMNLCTNAAHAMRDKGGILSVGLSDVRFSERNPYGLKPGEYLKLSVSDTGEGVPKDITEKIFDPFFTTKKQGEGTGLGLSVVHGIVRHLGGHITVESEQGKGATFCVYLPKMAEEASISSTVAQEGIPVAHGERILFIDDEEALVEMGQEILEELGYQVVSHRSSRTALAVFRLDPSRFDLIMTDQTMPEMTGVELAKEVLAIRPDMPIILCTGFSHLVNAETAGSAGISAFAPKPLTKKEIAKTIRKVLDRADT